MLLLCLVYDEYSLITAAALLTLLRNILPVLKQMILFSEPGEYLLFYRKCILIIPANKCPPNTTSLGDIHFQEKYHEPKALVIS